jgi:chromosome segregation ATPase
MRTASLASVVILASLLAASGCARGVKRENASLKNNNADLSAQLAQSNELNSSLQSRFEESESSLKQANARIKDLSTQLDAAKRAAFAAQSRYNEAFQSLQVLQAKSDQDAKALADANLQLSASRALMEKAMADSAASGERANAQIAELSRQIAQLQAKAAEQAMAPAAPAKRAPSRSAAAGEK